MTKPAPTDEKPKSRKPVQQQPKDSSKPKPRVRVSRNPPETIDLPSSQSPDIPEIVEIPLQINTDLPPKTPATTDIFSPPPTEPSTARPLAPRDTPPPTDLQSSTNGADLNGGRRRARAQVNYAEPSLNTKMRRPTKELCDAVGKDGKPLSVTGMASRAVVKPEPIEEGSGWKDLPHVPIQRESADVEPGSPLSNKSFSVPSRDTSMANGMSETSKRYAESSAAISAILRDTRIKKPQNAPAAVKSIMQASDPGNQKLARDNKLAHGGEEDKRASLAIFDIASSSPPRDIVDKQRPDSREGTRVSSRRHSSITALNNTSAKARSEDVVARGGSKSTSTASSLVASKHTAGAGATSGQAESDSEAGAGVGRSERAAARRRSMML
jgi:hypothetical protein